MLVFQLEHDVALQAGLAGLALVERLGHAAPAQQLDDLVLGILPIISTFACCLRNQVPRQALLALLSTLHAQRYSRSSIGT